MKNVQHAHPVLWGELPVDAVLGHVRRTGVFVRGFDLRLTEDALLNIDLAVEERPRSPDSGGYPRRPVPSRCATVFLIQLQES